MIKNILNVLFCLLMLVSFSGAVELQEYRDTGITVRYEAPLRYVARRIASEYPKTRTEIETKLGWRLKAAPAVILVRDHDAFQEMAGNTLVTAFALPERNLIVMDYSKMDKVPFDLEDTFKHELSHILLHQKVAASALPKWLDEGVAQWASGGAADIMRTGEKDVLKRAVLSRSMIPLRGIATSFPPSAESLILAYEESRSITEFIIQEYGEAKLRSLLRELAKGEAIEEALYVSLGVRLARLEQLWKENLSSENTWLAYLADHLIWVLFFCAAFITVAGFFLVKRRMKNYRDGEDQQEDDETAL